MLRYRQEKEEKQGVKIQYGISLTTGFITLTIPERREEPREGGEGAQRERGDSAEERMRGGRERGVDKEEKKIQIQS